mmetsp:Transcript_38822/g.82500  ORF Transcript_38822/g.82500 Transcript_38822/m.82500 type:complete len:318 (+) Transcript_38822:185-1138(+)
MVKMMLAVSLVVFLAQLLVAQSRLGGGTPPTPADELVESSVDAATVEAEQPILTTHVVSLDLTETHDRSLEESSATEETVKTEELQQQQQQQQTRRAESHQQQLNDLRREAAAAGGAGGAGTEDFDLELLRAANLTEGLSLASSEATFGYGWIATTTRYGDADQSSCGGMNTAALVAGTDYYSVASSQAMQSDFLWGASCCYCGKSASNCESNGVAPMGCFSCAKGRFLQRRPYVGGDLGGFASTEIRIVVSDVCPGDSTGWCQGQPGDLNRFGVRNHFDFSVPPPGVNNNFFVFTPEACSPELVQRMSGSERKCFR